MSQARLVPRPTAGPTAVLPLVGLLAAMVVLSACRSPSPEEALEGSRPNVVLVVLCSFRFDHLGAAGYARELTPFLDRLAERGVFFENAVSASSWTKPSVASLLTGLTPELHGMLDFYPLRDILDGEIESRRILPDGFVTLPEVLRAAGYDTFCRVNNVYAGKFFNLTQGCQDSLTREEMPTRRMLDDLAGWLAARRGDRAPFFAYVLDRDAHTPYNPPYEAYREIHGEDELVPPEEFRAFHREVNRRVWDLYNAGETIPETLQRQWTDLYDAQLPALDAALSRLPEILEAAGVADDTLLVVTADHGERFFEHGGIDHGRNLDQPLLEIPLIFAGPGVAAGQRRPEVVRGIDLLPTLAAFAGAEIPPLVQGRNLLPLLAEPEARLPEVSALSSFDTYRGRLHAVRMGRYKLLVGPGGEESLYDVEEDPFEHRDLRESEPRIARRLRSELRRWIEEGERLAPETPGTERRELPPEVVEELRALGYL